MIKHAVAVGFVAVFNLATAGAVGAQQVPNTSYNFSNTNPAFQMDRGPRICVDGGHHNFHTLEGRYLAFGRLVRGDGFRVAEIGQFTEGALSACEVVVVANALGAWNDQEGWQRPHDSAFPMEEIRALVSWVHAGGSLLLIVDHSPWPGAASDLALLLGVQMFDGGVSTAFYGELRDEAILRGAELSGMTPEQQRERLYGPGRRGSLGTHTILLGRSAEETVRGVRTFGGSAFYPSVQIQPLLIVGPDAVGTVSEAGVGQVPQDQVPRFDLAGWLAGGALERNDGRVVLLGEAATCSAQDTGGPARFPMGMNHPTAEQNAQFCLNVVRWLARVLDPPSVRRTEWDGVWLGIGDQGGFTYPVEITITGSTHAIAYPTLPCAGTLTLVNDAGDRRELDESITTGMCDDGGRAVLVRSGDQMSFEWFYQGAAQPTVTSTLTFSGR